MMSTLSKGLTPLRGLLRSPVGSTAARCLSSEVAQSFKALSVTEASPFVYEVKLNRPDKRNAMNEQLWSEIGAAFKALGEDEDCRVIVISGEGKMFSSGIDLSFLAQFGSAVQNDELDVSKKAKDLYKIITAMQSHFTSIEQCPKPVIAAIHGPCVGAGVDLITATDIRMCTNDAWFQVKEVDMGLAADVGTLQRLPKVVGSQSVVRDLCLTCRKCTSDEAEKIGLVSAVFPEKESMMAAALKMASSIASKSPVAVQGTKSNLNYARDHTVEESLEYEARWNSMNLQSRDVMTAAMSQMSKSEEPPKFDKL